MAATHEEAHHAGFADWLPIEDPDLARLPEALRLLPHASRVAFESSKSPWFLLARRLGRGEGVAEAIARDEEALANRGEFLPVNEDYLDIQGDEALFLECEWKNEAVAMKIAGLYVQSGEDELTVLWLAAPGDASSEHMLRELESGYGELRASFEPTPGSRYKGLLNGHALSFGLRSGEGSNAIELEGTAEVAEVDRAFFDAIFDVNPTFVAGIAHGWHDEARGVSLSMQTFRTETSMGPKDPFVYWLAGQLQTFVRRNKEDGDAPVELIHLEDAHTRVVSQEEIDRHYANNKRAPEAGVILATYIPRAPYARACRIRFAEEGDERPSLALFIELRDYRRSRSETVLRDCVVMLFARARDRADLVQLEQALQLRSEPLDEVGPFVVLPR